jgi:outer membrane protein assembly factor BamB
MKTNKRNIAISTVIILLMLCPTFLIYADTNAASSNTDTTVRPAVDYGNLLQYEWTSSSGGGNGPAMTNFAGGPAPASLDVAWTKPLTSFAAAINGMVFVVTSGVTYACDPNTGAEIFHYTGSGSILKIDNTYMLQGSTLRKIADGSAVWTDNSYLSLYGVTLSYTYDPANKLMWTAANCMWSFADPTKPPTLKWNQSIIEDGWIAYRDYAVIGDGKVFLKHLSIEVKCLDEFTGQVIWVTNTKGTITYQALYGDGKFMAGSLSGVVECFDGKTGKELWTYDPHSYWDFWASWPAYAYGIFYEQNYDGYIYAINATTGQLIWKYQGPGQFYPAGPTVADYKVYVQLGTANFRDPATWARGYDYSVCLDALTGKVLFSANIETGQYMGAFGNMYVQLSQQNQSPSSWHGHTGAPSTDLWCISGKPQDWAVYGKDLSNSFTGAGPIKLNLKWAFQTGGAVVAGPIVAQGVVYVGSYDFNIYAINASTGTKIWSFPTGYQVKSSVAYDNGKIYTGPDDGNMYCLNANTGAQIWKTSITSMTTYMSIFYGPQTRPSPKVYNGKVYCGCINGNMYSLDASTGAILSTFNSNGMILDSPAIVNGVMYFQSQTKFPNMTLYALNTNNFAVIWALGIPYMRTRYITATSADPSNGNIQASPVYADGALYMPLDGGSAAQTTAKQAPGGLMKINATTGKVIWNADTYWTSDTVISRAPMILVHTIPHYVSTLPANTTGPDGALISYENRNLDLNNVALQRQDMVVCNDLFVKVIGLNATDGKQLWGVYVSREIYGAAAGYAGNVFAQTESKALFNFNAISGAKLAYTENVVQSWSNPALYNGFLYRGDQNWNVQCFGE